MFRLPVKICLCAVIYLIYLANNAKGLNLEGLISDVKLLKENYVSLKSHSSIAVLY